MLPNKIKKQGGEWESRPPRGAGLQKSGGLVVLAYIGGLFFFFFLIVLRGGQTWWHGPSIFFSQPHVLSRYELMINHVSNEKKPGWLFDIVDYT